MRKSLPHHVPSWVKPGSQCFLTLCGATRGENQFCHQEIAAKLFASVAHRQRETIWFVRLLVLMPDHLHFLLSLPPDRALTPTIRLWKGYLARQAGIRWQRDFFEHRLRNDGMWEEKARYMRENPVRAGLVADPKAWPYVWEP
ncbi:MAG: REP-associated tyrosine transposase [Opitutales bacterium]